jgi:hypothetical protein
MTVMGGEEAREARILFQEKKMPFLDARAFFFFREPFLDARSISGCFQK